MGLTAGIVGLPNVGKSTLFNAVTKAGIEAANYPFCTIDPNVGVVTVPDRRMDKLVEMVKPQKITPAVVELVDIAGLVKGASKGEGLGNQFLSHIREVDAILQVVRCFEDENIVHVEGKVDPVRDIEIINLELVFADMESVGRRIDRTQKAAKSGDKKLAEELVVLQKINELLEDGKPARILNLSDEEKTCIKDLHLLTLKPILYVANVSEDDIRDWSSNDFVKQLKAKAKEEGAEVVVISAQIESEISELSDEEAKTFLNDMGLDESGLDKLVRATYSLLGLITYFTAGEKEVRAWTITEGTPAPAAAGKIHSDIERGFIRAEVVSFDDLVANGSMAACKEKGVLRLEGKEYIVKDGDVVYFRFNV